MPMCHKHAHAPGHVHAGVDRYHNMCRMLGRTHTIVVCTKHRLGSKQQQQILRAITTTIAKLQPKISHR